MTQQSAPTLAIIGNGPAAHRVIEQLRHYGDQRTILLFGEEGEGYNRIRLSEWLAKGCAEADLVTHDTHRYNQLNVTFIPERVVSIDKNNHSLTTKSGENYHWDQLILATGSLPRKLGIKGEEAGNVRGFRTREDVHYWLPKANQTPAEAVVIGGGVLGIEAAEGLREQGYSVTLVHRSSHLMKGQLDDVSARWLEDNLTQRGIRLVLGASPVEFICSDDGLATDVRLSNGQILPGSHFVVCAGTIPDTRLADASNLKHLVGKRGFVCTRMMQTPEETIFAIGECAEVEGVCVGLVIPALAQADICADILTGKPASGWHPSPMGVRIKVSGLDVYARGQVVAQPGDHCLQMNDFKARKARTLVIRKNRLVGVVLFDALEGMSELDQLFSHTLPESLNANDLMFEPDAVLQDCAA